MGVRGVGPTKVLSVFSLVMINVIAVDSLRTLPITAKLGYSLISYYLLAALVFFIPVGFVAAELATAYPRMGGIYVWVREAFGVRAGFMTIWLQWVYNVVWYPTIMAFIATILAYLFDPDIANNKIYLLSTTLGLFWLFTIFNCFGMRVSSAISALGALFGTILPMIVVIILGVWWVIAGHPVPVHSAASLFPDLSSLNSLPLFSAVLFGLIGLEMSAVHAENVQNPRRDYPRAIIYSTLIIFLTLVLGSLAIVIVVPADKLSVVSGLIDAYMIFFKTFGTNSWLLPCLIGLIIFGALSGVSAWIIGPTKGLLVAAQDGVLPAIFANVNSHGAPIALLIIQGIVFSILSMVFILFNSINVAYWLLSDLSAQMALLVYVFMFAAAIKLRYSQPERLRGYRIPGNNSVMWVVAGSGILCCILTVIIGFLPPTQIPIKNVFWFECFLGGGLIIFVALPWLCAKNYGIKP